MGPGHPRAFCCRSTTPLPAGEELGMGASDSPGKPFDISKRDVWDAWLKVKENQGAPGVDGCSVADFEKDLKNNLYKVWNRMSSGSYCPPPVRAVEIAKPHGDGMRTRGIPTPWPTASPKPWWPDTWRNGWNRSSTPTPTATAPGDRRTTRSRRRGGGAGSTTGCSISDIRAFFDTVPWEHVLAAIAAH